MKKKLFIVFDQIPPATAGGLVFTYTQLIPLLGEFYEVEVISVFESGVNEFMGRKVHNLIHYQTDVTLSMIKTYFSSGEILKALNIPFSSLLYYLDIPTGRRKTAEVLSSAPDSVVLAVSPAAAMYIPKNHPYILEIHSTYDYFYNGGLIQKSQIRLMNQPSMILFRTEADAKKAAGLGNSSFVYNFIKGKAKSEIELSDLKKRKNRIIFLARLEEVKDPLRMLHLAELLKKKIPDFTLDIYGSGSMEEPMKQFILEHGLTDQVHLKGFTNDKSVYQNYSLIWMTSKYEGLGMTLVEAKQMGVPAVVTCWGDQVYEVVEPGMDGFVCQTDEEFVEKTVMLLENESMLLDFSRNALQSFERFGQDQARASWKKILNDFEKEYLN